MKIELQELSQSKRRFDVHFDENEVSEHVQQTEKSLAGSLHIDGFRRGKAPLALLKRRKGFDAMVKEELTERVVLKGYREAFKRHEKIAPVADPSVREFKYDNGVISFSMFFDVIPEFELAEYKGIKLKKVIRRISESDVNQTLEKLREQMASYNDAGDRAAVEGDVAMINFKGKDEKGNEMEGASAQNHTLVLGRGTMIPGFEDNIIGMKPGETKTFNITFPADYHNKEIAGQKAVFEVNLIALKERELPDLDDKWATGIGGPSVKTIDDLKMEIRKQLEKEEKEKSEKQLRNSLSDSLLNANPFEAPESMVLAERKRLDERLNMEKLIQGREEDEIKKINEDANRAAEAKVRESLIMHMIARRENITVDDEQVLETLREWAASDPEKSARIGDMAKNPDVIENIRYDMVMKNTFDYLLENADVSEEAIDNEKS